MSFRFKTQNGQDKALKYNNTVPQGEICTYKHAHAYTHNQEANSDSGVLSSSGA